MKVALQYIDGWKERMEDEVLAYEKKPIVKGQIVCYGPFLWQYASQFADMCIDLRRAEVRSAP